MSTHPYEPIDIVAELATTLSDWLPDHLEMVTEWRDALVAELERLAELEGFERQEDRARRSAYRRAARLVKG